MKKGRIGSLIIAAFLLCSYSVVFADEKSDAQKRLEESQAAENKLKEEQASIASEVKAIKESIANVESQIKGIEAGIESSKKLIEQKEALIKSKEEEIAKHQTLLDQRIRSYYKIDRNTQYLYILLESDGFSEFMTNVKSIHKLMSVDKKLIIAATEAQKQIEAEKEDIVKLLKKSEEDKVIVMEKRKELEAKNGELLARQEEINNQISYNSQVQQDIQNFIDELNRKNENIIPPQVNPTIPDSGGDTPEIPDVPSASGFIRPSGGPITDPFGPRINPVTGKPGMHNGTDFGAPTGAPIVAAKAGTVIFSGWRTDYGNTVIINHGNGEQTLYAHASELLVSAGQTVPQGQTIAKIGSTGMSTGPHLHFEIRINGVPVDPMKYL